MTIIQIRDQEPDSLKTFSIQAVENEMHTIFFIVSFHKTKIYHRIGSRLSHFSYIPGSLNKCVITIILLTNHILISFPGLYFFPWIPTAGSESSILFSSIFNHRKSYMPWQLRKLEGAVLNGLKVLLLYPRSLRYILKTLITQVYKQFPLHL